MNRERPDAKNCSTFGSGNRSPRSLVLLSEALTSARVRQGELEGLGCGEGGTGEIGEFASEEKIPTRLAPVPSKAEEDVGEQAEGGKSEGDRGTERDEREEKESK